MRNLGVTMPCFSQFNCDNTQSKGVFNQRNFIFVIFFGVGCIPIDNTTVENRVSTRRTTQKGSVVSRSSKQADSLFLTFLHLVCFDITNWCVLVCIPQSS
ncbi:hypothetical protein AN214_00184 [Pseudoalteromonas sp. P1-9]|nr:hypothetical protein AN214_00184 [Pseudoalteromonas sp. P1-9]